MNRVMNSDLVDHFYIGQKNHHNGDTKDINL